MLNRTHSVVVAGVFRDYARQHGAVLIDRADYIALTGDRTANDGALWLVPGATPATVIEALRALPGGEQLDIAEPGEIREVSLRVFDRSFAVTYAMEAVAVLVGLFGLSSSLGAIVLARRREFGVLRHLGLTRSQIRGMLAAEGGLLALVGSAAGLAAARSAWCLSMSSTASRSTGAWSFTRRTCSLPIHRGARRARGTDRGGVRQGSDGHGAGARGTRGLVGHEARTFFFGLGLLPLAAWAEQVRYPDVTPGRKLEFPRDHGAHPEFRIEWWYVTGWLDGPLGFQITFFRARPEEASDNPSAFNPRQVLFAHARCATRSAAAGP